MALFLKTSINIVSETIRE